METRRRGREARSNTDEAHADLPTPADPPVHSLPNPPSNPSLPAPTTRSRTPRSASAHPSTRQLRPPRPSSSRPSRSSHPSFPPPTAPPSLDTPRRPSRRHSTLQSLPALQAPSRPQSSRKRTRSTSRRLATAAASTPSPQPPLQPLPSRPAKRARRSSQSRTRGPNFGPPRLLNTTSVGRRTRAMNSSNPADTPDDSHPDSASNRPSDDGPSSLGSDRGAPTTLHGLLRRIGADLRDIFPNNGGTSHSRLQHLRTAIVAQDNPDQQMEALQELCEFLSVGTEETLVSFSVNLFVAPLVNLLQTGANVEVKIYAARALTHMMEALPSSSSAIALNGAAGPLCQNLLSIEYIDLAEQSLSALHKLSVDYPQQIVSASGFQAVLSFIDFFSIGVQRKAAATACNLCRQPRGDAMQMIGTVLPTMMRLLSSDDQRIRESAVLGFTKLAEAYRSSSEKLESLCGEDLGLIEKVLSLIVPPSPPALSPQSYSSALRMLAIVARGSAKLSLQILSTDTLIMKLKSRLASGSTVHSVDCLTLADSLLPEAIEQDNQQGSSTRSRRRRSLGSAATFVAIDTKRREALEEDSSSLRFFGSELFEILMKFYISSADSNARRLALSVMSKFIAIAPRGVLGDVILGDRIEDGPLEGQNLTTIRFCPFVAALLGENSSKNEALVGLAMTSSALEKLTSLREAFVREGVIHEIVRLAALGTEIEGENGESITQKPESRSRVTLAGSSSARSEHTHVLSLDNSNPAINLRDMDSVWGALAALQQGSTDRGSRSESGTQHHRIPSRALHEFRFPNISSFPSMVPTAARSILNQYLGGKGENTVNEELLKNNILDQLTKICESLNSVGEKDDESRDDTAMSEFISLLATTNGLTVFEVSKSGIMEALAGFFSPKDQNLSAHRLFSTVNPLNAHKDKKPFTSLINLSLGVLAAEEKLDVHTNESTHGTSSLSVNSGLRQLTQPFKLRLKRAAADAGGENLRDYSNHIVLIEPLATMASVQDFLWPKVREVRRSTSEGGTANQRTRQGRLGRVNSRERDSRPSGELEIDESASGADEDQLDEDGEENRFPVQEFFAVAEEMMDEDGLSEEHIIDQGDASDDDVSSAEEDMIEQDPGDSEDHDHDGPESFDVDQLATTLPPFELDHESLGQAPTRVSGVLSGSPREHSSRQASASRSSGEILRNEGNFRSYAAALADNMPQTLNSANSLSMQTGRNSRRSINARPGSSQELSFSLNGVTLAHDYSILSAVIQSSARQRGLGPGLWSDVHTLVYSKRQECNQGSLSGDAKSLVESRNADPTTGEGSSAGPVRRSQRLLQSRERSKIPAQQKSRKDAAKISEEFLLKVDIAKDNMPAPRKVRVSSLPSSIASVIEVLKHLHWISEKLSTSVLTEEEKGASDMSDDVAVRFPILLEKPEVHFVSHKLTAKLVRQLSDPLALCGGIVPSWCFTLAREASFLLPFTTRRILFQSTSLGVTRALHLLQTRIEMAGVTTHRSPRSHRESETRIGRIQRQKVRIHRNRMLESAIKVMNMYCSHGTVLEVEYFNEAGTGLGPTLEFYTLTSREIQMVDLRLWRSSGLRAMKEKVESDNVTQITPMVREEPQTSIRGSSTRRRSRRQSTSNASSRQTPSSNTEPPAYVVPTGAGLFPSCLPITMNDVQRSASSKTCSLFQFIGRLLGKAVMDGRLLDLRFSDTFSQLLLAYCRVIYDSYEPSDQMRANSWFSNEEGFNCSKGESLPKLDVVDREKVWHAFTNGTSAMKLLEKVDLQLALSLQSIVRMVGDNEGDAIPGLCLTFVLPGDDSIELVKGGSNIEVTESNAEEFVRRVTYHVLFGGVHQQAEALLRGFGELVEITSLLVFEPPELELLFCGPAYEEWSAYFLVQATRCDHGYSHESAAVKFFLRLLSELGQEEQQSFVQFTTGSPALPLGGLRNLHPRLTIVRRTPENGRSPDQCLPTVMTCTNYFKLPDYSSYEIAKKQVMYAVREGQRSFHLS